MTLTRLARNWWMVAIRGNLAILFGLTLLTWRDMDPGVLIVLFGVYAVLDGVWAIASAITLSRRVVVLPIILEGVASVVLGAIALGWPHIATRELIRLLAGWGLVTGLFELMASALLPRESNVHWLWGTAGVFSVFLAILIQLLPRAGVARIVSLLGGYAIVFGVIVAVTAYRFRAHHRGSVARPWPAAVR